MKLAIIGGGASGLFCAVAAAQTYVFSSVTVYERLDRVGKKLLATGNGHCNLANTNRDSVYYHSLTPDAAMKILAHLPAEAAVESFRRMGLFCRVEESGRVYPYSAQASAVLDVLRFRAAELNVRFQEGCEIRSLQKTPKGFVLRAEGVKYESDMVVVASGGKASPQFGSNGSGFSILSSFGHTVTPLFPSIVQLKTDTTWTRQLKGVKIDAEVSIYGDGELRRKENGEVLFTDYGLSGTAVLQLSRAASEYESCYIELDAMPGCPLGEVTDMLRERAQICRNRALLDFFTGLLNKRFGQVLLKSLGYVLSDPAAILHEPDFLSIANQIKRFTVAVTGTTGFQNAQATAGGADLSQFDAETLESLLVPGLFACGEVLDVDGDCGGFNLTWSWASAYTAAQGAAARLKRSLHQ